MGMIDHRHCARTFCAVLVAVVCFCTPAATHACSEYQHVWQTVGENSTAELTPQVLTVFLELVARHLPDPPASWGLTIVGLPPTAATTTTDLIAQLGGLPDSASAANAQQAVTVTKPARLLANSKGTGKAVRSLDPGMMLYPTGNKDGMMWEVEDELGNKGWVNSTMIELSR